jgi:hypothetical protein
MKKEIKLLLLVCTAFAVFAACRPTVDFTPIDPLDKGFDGMTYVTKSDSYADIFRAFWEGMDVNYVYWDVEPTGYWDEVLNKYKPLFDALGDYHIGDSSEAAKAQISTARQYIQEMVSPLHDGHLNVSFELYSPLDPPSDYTPLKPRSYSPVNAKVDARYSSPTDPNTNPKTTFKSTSGINKDALEQVFGNSLLWATGRNGSPIMATGEMSAAEGYTGPGHIRYLYFDQFAFSGLNSGIEIQEVKEAYLADLCDPRCRGVIFDIRGNRGGLNEDLALLLAPLLTSDLTFAYTRLKKGVGRLNYTPWAPYTLKANPVGPSRAANAGAMPVVALVNDYSISCGEVMPMVLKAMPKGRVIGTQTWGATGPRIGDTSPSQTHGGSFKHNKLWTQVIQAGFQTRGLHFESYEGIGIKPDKVIEFDLAKFNAGKDVQLQEAIRYVESQQ